VPERIAEVEHQHVLEIEQQLDRNGLVETEPLAQGLDILRWCTSGFAGQHGRGVAGRKLQKQEVQNDYADHDRHRLR
jgi:hypothetical protein